MSQPDLIQLTREYGGEWGVKHAERILYMVQTLGEGMVYDLGAMRIAAYLHDWGGYAKWARPGAEHQVVSCEVVGAFLREHDFPADTVAKVLEMIQYHHGGPAGRSVESTLFTDADALDLLGVVGVCRVFAMNPRDIRKGWEAVQRWRDISMAAIQTEHGKALAEQRVQETNMLLEFFEKETFGMF